MSSRICLAFLACLAVATPLHAQYLLLPMDGAQANHLRSYGLAY